MIKSKTTNGVVLWQVHDKKSDWGSLSAILIENRKLYITIKQEDNTISIDKRGLVDFIEMLKEIEVES